MTTSRKIKLTTLGIIFIIIAFCITYFICHVILPRTISRTFQDPTGEYTLVISYRSFWSHIPTMPGDSGGKPGFMKIVDSKGKNYGEMPLVMIQLGPYNANEIKWTEHGASMSSTAIVEWNFKENSCWYWDMDAGEKRCSR